MVDATLTRGQRQTRKARETYAARFLTPEAKTEHFRELGKRAAEQRLTLGADDVAALGECLSLLRQITARHPKIVPADGSPSENAVTAGGQPAGQEGGA